MKELWVDVDPDCPQCAEIVAWRREHPLIPIDRRTQIIIGPGTSRDRHVAHREAKAVPFR